MMTLEKVSDFGGIPSSVALCAFSGVVLPSCIVHLFEAAMRGAFPVAAIHCPKLPSVGWDVTPFERVPERVFPTQEWPASMSLPVCEFSKE